MTKLFLKAGAAIVLASAACALMSQARESRAKPAPTLWAAISVSEPVFRESWTKNLQIFFAIVNDGNATLDPKCRLSRLYVNGQEMKDWSFIIANGPRSSEFDALPPHRCLEFAYAMGEKFKQPGVYKLRWEGKNFQAPEITFRVLPPSKKPGATSSGA